MKTIGVLGGMGPQASLKFYERVLFHSQSSYCAFANADFPHLIISNLPVPDLISDNGAQNIAVDMVTCEAKALQNAGADILTLVCNTMHLFLSEYTKDVSIPFLSIIDSVAEQIVNDKKHKVGILGSNTLLESGIYQETLGKNGIMSLIPSVSERKILSQVIMSIIAGTITEEQKRFLNQLVDQLVASGAEGIVLGCTELPLVLNNHMFSVLLYDSLDILARKVCAIAYSESD